MSNIHEINLVPPDIIEERMRWRRIKKWSIFIICQVLCFCLLGISFYAYSQKLKNEITSLQKHNLRVKQTERELVLSYHNIKDLLKTRQALLHLTQRYCLSPVLLSLAQDINPKTRLTRLSLERIQKTYYHIKLWGISQSYQDLSNFLLHLQQDKSLQEIKLIKSDVDEKSFVYFEISLSYLNQILQESKG